MNRNCSIFWDLRNLQEQVKKAFCHHKLFWPFTVWINCPSDLKIYANSRPSASNSKSFSWSKEYLFLTVCQNNFCIKILYPIVPSNPLVTTHTRNKLPAVLIAWWSRNMRDYISLYLMTLLIFVWCATFSQKKVLKQKGKIIFLTFPVGF